MFYDVAITIPAGTLKESPVIEEMRLTKGVIHTLRLDFPPGPRGEVSVVIVRGDYQLFPTNRDGAFNADNTYINFDDNVEMLDEPYSLYIKGWSPTATYDHTITVQVGVIESGLALAVLKIAAGLDRLLSLMGIKV